MNQSSEISRVRDAASAYAENITVPQYNEAAIRSRAAGMPGRLRDWRRSATAVAAAVLLIALVLNGRSVVAQMEHMLQAFVTVGGRNVPALVRSVSLDQARRDMPFPVIAPAAIPARLQETIDEIVPGTSRIASRLVFQFGSGHGLPLTIIESSAQAKTIRTQMGLWMKNPNSVAKPAPALPPPSANGEHAFMQSQMRAGMQPPAHIGTGQIAVQPIDWSVRGTNIQLISPPGLLSNAQIAAIRRMMSY